MDNFYGTAGSNVKVVSIMQLFQGSREAITTRMLVGGLGVTHKNMSAKAQAAEV